MRNPYWNRLDGRPGDADAIRRLILAGGEVGRFQDPARPYVHPEDVDIAPDIDRYDFAVRIEFEMGDQSRVWGSRPDAESNEPTHRQSNVPHSFRSHRAGFNRQIAQKPLMPS